jgi:hypothetical protein
MTDEAQRLINDIRVINSLLYAPAAIKMQMVMLAVRIAEKRLSYRDEEAANLRDTLAAMMSEYTAPSAPITEESALYAAALQSAAAQETESIN